VGLDLVAGLLLSGQDLIVTSQLVDGQFLLAMMRRIQACNLNP
jgi:hypothetical protein